jgi:hypothetical protein
MNARMGIGLVVGIMVATGAPVVATAGPVHPECVGPGTDKGGLICSDTTQTAGLAEVYIEGTWRQVETTGGPPRGSWGAFRHIRPGGAQDDHIWGVVRVYLQLPERYLGSRPQYEHVVSGPHDGGTARAARRTRRGL